MVLLPQPVGIAAGETHAVRIVAEGRRGLGEEVSLHSAVDRRPVGPCVDGLEYAPEDIAM